ncbi:MAG: hypothetical protein NTZ73_02750 [Candidatus Diapherotrites archaeon]|nr:hypothetical protein [Candidatus Diapherotrites archaeon]
MVSKNEHWHMGGFSTGGLLFGLFLVAWGTIWMGNDLGWWSISFPVAPAAILFIGLMVVIGAIRKFFWCC